MTGAMQDDIRSYEFFQKLTELYYVEAIYLIGSRATGTYEESSDVDLVVLCPTATDEQWQHVKKIVHTRDLLAEVDVMRLDTLPPGDFKAEINRTKALLYICPEFHRLKALEHTLKNHAQTIRQFKNYLNALGGKRVSAGIASQPISVEDLDEQTKTEVLKKFHLTLHHLKSTLRLALLVAGVRVVAPMDIFRKAHQQGWLGERKNWEQMLHHWRCAEQKCSPELKTEIISQLPAYAELMQASITKMQDYYAEIEAEQKQEEGLAYGA